MKKTIGIALALLLLFVLPSAFAETITLSFIGDCSIGEAIQYRGYENSYTAVLDEHGYDWPFSLVYPILSTDDWTFANLEVVFTTRTKHQDKRYPLSALPEYAQTLLHSGIDVLNTANNHAYDFLMAGYEESMQTLDDLGVPHFGSFNLGTLQAQDLLWTQTVNGIKIGGVGFSYPQETDANKVANRVQELRDQGCDLVIVSMHWGRENTTTPEAYQVYLAKEAIKAGADVVWGHHPHILQPVQFYNGKPIFYSTGNFTFGTMSSVDPDTGIFQLTYEIDGEAGITLQSFSVVPCRTQGSGDYRPYELTDPAERTAMLKKLITSREYTGVVNLPDSFADTGRVEFTNGEMVE